MQSRINRVILIIMEDETRHVYSVPGDSSAETMINDVINADEIDRNKIKTNYFFPNTLFSASDYLHYFNEETKKIDEIHPSIDFKLEEFKKQRKSFFSILDLEFMKSLEEDCVECKEHIVKMKNYLRDAPEKIDAYCKDLPIKDIIQFNAFNNIFDIVIINGGNGYAKPPAVQIDPPNGLNMTGFQMKAIATIKDGTISDIIVTEIGSGYGTIPRVSVSRPEDKNGEPAILTAHPPENDIYSIKENMQEIKHGD